MRALLLLATLASMLQGCSARQEIQRYEYVELVMASPARLVIYAEQEKLARTAARAAYDRMHELDRALSDWNQQSHLSLLVAAAPDPVAADPILRDALIQSIVHARATNGAFDPTLGPLVHTWRNARRTGVLPAPQAIAQARSLVGIDQIEVTPETLRLTRKGVALDLGGIGKGIAVDEAAAVLRAHDLGHHLVDLDGEIRLGAAPPQRSAWQVEIQAHGDGSTLVLELLERSVSTSGDLHQFIEIDGVRYSHVLDPTSGIGLTRQIQVTVIAPNNTMADALATAGSVLGAEDLATIISTHYPDASAVVTTIDGGRTELTRIGNPPVHAPVAP